MNIHVVAIRTNFDLRGVHKSRIHFGSKCKLAVEVVMLVNRARSMFRLIDYHSNVHTFYLEKGNVLDVGAMKSAVAAFGGLNLVIPSTSGFRRRTLRKRAA